MKKKTEGDDRFPGSEIDNELFSHDEDLETSDCKYFIKHVRSKSYSIIYCSLRGKVRKQRCLDCREYTNKDDDRGIPDPDPF